jgi:hypothetical protein
MTEGAPTPDKNHTDAHDATAPGAPSLPANAPVAEETTEDGMTNVTRQPKRK